MARWLKNPIHIVVLMFSLVPPIWMATFLWVYRLNLPIQDTLLRSYPLAVAVRNGTATLSDFFTPYVGHVATVSYSITALVTWLTGWNVTLEIFIGFLVITLCYPVLMLMVWRTDEASVVLVAIPISVLLFSIRQERILFIGYGILTWYPIHLSLLCILALTFCVQQRWWIPVAGIVLSVLATFSHGQGFLVLWLILMAWWFAGYRQWWLYLIGVVYAIGMTLIYMTLAEVIFSAEGGGTANLVNVNAILGIVPFFASYIAGLVTGPPAVGWVALILMVVNLIYLFRLPSLRRWLWMWLLVLAYTFGTAALVTMTRSSGYIDAAYEPQFRTPAMLFWIPLIVFGAMIVQREWRGTGWSYRLMLFNLLCAFIAGIGWGTVNHEPEPFYHGRFLNETCHRRFIYVQDVPRSVAENCPLIGDPDAVNVLAYYDMAMFTNFPQETILPAGYRVGTPVIVMGEQGWDNYHIARWLLADVLEADIYHYTPITPVAHPEYDVNLTLPNLMTDPEAMIDQLQATEDFWVIHRDDMAPALPQPLQSDYVSVNYIHRTPEGIGFTLSLYQRVAIDRATPIRFGENIRMIGYTGIGDRLGACSTVTIRSFWEVIEPPLLDGYSATLTLDRITGEGTWDFENVIRVDSQLTSINTDSWELGALYVDDRQLSIPCDLSPGAYALQLGVYNYRDNVRLAPYIDEQPPAPEQDIARIEIVTVD